MNRCLIFILVVLLAAVCSPASAQTADGSVHARKLVRRVVPVYPELARRHMMLGVVKIVATVAPNGSVKSIVPVGGNPVLLSAAQEAVRNWKFAAGPTETQELIELRFAPE